MQPPGTVTGKNDKNTVFNFKSKENDSPWRCEHSYWKTATVFSIEIQICRLQ